MNGPIQPVIDAFGEPTSTVPSDYLGEGEFIREWALPAGGTLVAEGRPDSTAFVSATSPDGSTPLALAEGLALGRSTLADFKDAWDCRAPG